MHLKFFIFILTAFLTVGCSEDGGSSHVNQARPAVIEGAVFDDHGRVEKAAIEVMDKNDRRIAKAKLQDDGQFKLKIPADAAYPVVLKAKLANGKILEAVVTSNQVVELDITPHTDLVVKSARLRGGLTPENIAGAAGAAINMRRSQGGKRSSSGFKGDLTKQYSGWH